MIGISFTLNDKPVSIVAEPFDRLAPILAERFGLTSVRTSCGIGRCGACMVLMDGKAVNACLLIAGKVEGAEIVTAEGLAEVAAPIITALERRGAIQCGYCAPGLLVSLAAAYCAAEPLSAGEVETLLQGNLCRCTGYAGIKAAIGDVFGA